MSDTKGDVVCFGPQPGRSPGLGMATAPADLKKWARRDWWHIAEGAMLILGFEPFDVTRNPSWPEGLEDFDDIYETALRSGALRDQLYVVSPRHFLAWARGKGYPIPERLEELVNRFHLRSEGREIEWPADNRDTAPVANIFKTMDGLKWSEVVMTFIEPEAVRIKARGKSETFTYEAMGFKDLRSRTAKPNLCWNTLRTIAIVANTDKNLTDTLPPQTDFKHRVSRLRDALQEFFGIKGDPIPYTTAYSPAFVLTAEEYVIRNARDQVAPDDEDEEDISALMSSPPGR